METFKNFNFRAYLINKINKFNTSYPKLMLNYKK